MNFTKFPRRNYLQGPTPIESLPSLSKALGGAVDLYIKRDDLLPGSGGGNKTRKLEFCIADALDQGADAIIHLRCRPVEPCPTYGGLVRQRRPRLSPYP